MCYKIGFGFVHFCSVKFTPSVTSINHNFISTQLTYSSLALRDYQIIHWFSTYISYNDSMITLYYIFIILLLFVFNLTIVFTHYKINLNEWLNVFVIVNEFKITKSICIIKIHYNRVYELQYSRISYVNLT